MHCNESFEAIIFDMDGVLIESSAIHDAAFREVLGGYGIPPFDYSAIAGIRTREALRGLLLSGGVVVTEDQLSVLARRKSEIARSAMKEFNPIVPGCVEVLQRIGSEYRLAVASSASRETVELMVTRDKLAGTFEVVLSGDDVRHAKPDPEIYSLCCERLDLEPSQCLVIEDAVSGVLAARRAGTQVAGLVNAASEWILRCAGADYILHSLAELPIRRQGAPHHG